MFEKNQLEPLQFLYLRVDQFTILSQMNFVLTHNFIGQERFYCLLKQSIINERFFT